ncbi:antitoxin [Corynebacterium sp. H128]|uniref:antitoxin n=1 Tax=unclassified Corynebacterium TaxID=2624378 RepID=UPI0030A8D0B4
MGIMDQAKDFAEKNPGKVDEIIEKVGDIVDSKTQGKYADKVDQAQQMAKEKMHGQHAATPAQEETPEQPH